MRLLPWCIGPHSAGPPPWLWPQHPWTSNLGPRAPVLSPPQELRHGTPWTWCPSSDIWWQSLETCSNLFTWGPTLPTGTDIWWPPEHNTVGKWSVGTLLEIFLVTSYYYVPTDKFSFTEMSPFSKRRIPNLFARSECWEIVVRRHESTMCAGHWPQLYVNEPSFTPHSKRWALWESPLVLYPLYCNFSNIMQFVYNPSLTCLKPVWNLSVTCLCDVGTFS